MESELLCGILNEALKASENGCGEWIVEHPEHGNIAIELSREPSNVNGDHLLVSYDIWDDALKTMVNYTSTYRLTIQQV